MPLPNGLKTSLDGQTLCVSASHLLLWRAYPIKPDGSVGEGRVFFEPEGWPDRQPPDGFCLDEQGNLYLPGRGGVWVVKGSGTLIGFVPIKEFCSNATIGGPDNRTLYLTCDKKVYSLDLRVR